VNFVEVEQAKHGQELAPCPLCGSRAGIWQVTHGSGVVQKVAMCSHGEADEPLGLITSCPMSLPDGGFFYESTYRTAAKVWNDFAAACDARRAAAVAPDVSTGACLMALAVIRELTGTQRTESLDATINAVRAAFAATKGPA
jgi:hypothetical protein